VTNKHHGEIAVESVVGEGDCFLYPPTHKYSEDSCLIFFQKPGIVKMFPNALSGRR